MARKENNTKYTFTMEAELDYESIDVYPSGLITKDAEGNYYVLDEMGNNNLGRSYGKAECFSTELFLVYDAETWPNSCGLVKADGTVVLPCEAAIINPVKGTDRYLKVSVATEPTDRKTHFSIRIPAGSPGRKNSQNTMTDMIIIMI